MSPHKVKKLEKIFKAMLKHPALLDDPILKKSVKEKKIKAYSLAVNIKGTLYIDVTFGVFLLKKYAKIRLENLSRHSYIIVPITITYTPTKRNN